jgi:hypothetical protein
MKIASTGPPEITSLRDAVAFTFSTREAGFPGSSKMRPFFLICSIWSVQLLTSHTSVSNGDEAEKELEANLEAKREPIAPAPIIAIYTSSVQIATFVESYLFLFFVEILSLGQRRDIGDRRGNRGR